LSFKPDPHYVRPIKQGNIPVPESPNVTDITSIDGSGQPLMFTRGGPMFPGASAFLSLGIAWHARQFPIPQLKGKMKTFAYLVMIVLIFANSAYAGEAAIKAEMAKKFPYSILISVRKTPYLGLYEVAFDDRLVYTDEKMTYLFSGNVIDLHTMKNLTEAREKQLYAINFDTLPLDLAIRKVKGNGNRKLAVFTDPNCQYCKKLEKEMVDLNNATVYIFVLPILPGSEEKANAIWCSSDRLKAWEDHMLRGIEPKSATNCDTSALGKIAMEAEKLKINVTPTLIFADGVIKPGTLTLELLEEHLAEAGQKN
jgi:thiol:disulfide interchange protein DsbC